MYLLHRQYRRRCELELELERESVIVWFFISFEVCSLLLSHFWFMLGSSSQPSRVLLCIVVPIVESNEYTCDWCRHFYHTTSNIWMPFVAIVSSLIAAYTTNTKTVGNHLFFESLTLYTKKKIFNVLFSCQRYYRAFCCCCSCYRFPPSSAFTPLFLPKDCGDRKSKANAHKNINKNCMRLTDSSDLAKPFHPPWICRTHSMHTCFLDGIFDDFFLSSFT